MRFQLICSLDLFVTEQQLHSVVTKLVCAILSKMTAKLRVKTTLDLFNVLKSWPLTFVALSWFLFTSCYICCEKVDEKARLLRVCYT